MIMHKIRIPVQIGLSAGVLFLLVSGVVASFGYRWEPMVLIATIALLGAASKFLVDATDKWEIDNQARWDNVERMDKKVEQLQTNVAKLQTNVEKLQTDVEELKAGQGLILEQLAQLNASYSNGGGE